MQPNMAEVASFGPFCLSVSQRLLTKDRAPVKIGGRAFDLLSVLVDSAGSVVSQRELLERAWPGIFVEDVSLRVRIADLRKVLEQDGQRYLANIPGRGYSFVGQVSRESVETHDQSPERLAPIAGGNLPTPLTRLFGRSVVIADLHRRLAEARLVTIVGAGGVGKTSVAVAAAHEAAPAHAWFADLAPVSDPSLLRIAVLEAFGLAASPDNMLAALSHRLAGQKALLVLDNCEHLVHACAAIAEALLGSVSGLQILATSREPLRAAGEWVVRLPALETPDNGMSLEGAAACSAVQLFVQRAAASDDRFLFDERTLPSVIDICQRLDGMPLALELAAGAVGAFGVRAVAHRLREQLELPPRGRRTAAARQATLRATLEWSYDLLPPHEQRALRQLAVFQGAFTLESAANVAAGLGPGDPSMLELLAELAEKSLLSVDLSRDEARYRLLQTTRFFALERLTPRELAATRARHASEMRRLAEATDLAWGMGDSAHARRDSADLMDDLGAAIEWALSPAGDLSTSVNLIIAGAPLRRRLSLTRDHRKQVERALEQVRARSEPDPAAEMRLLASYGLGSAFRYATREWIVASAERLQALALELGDVDHFMIGLWDRAACAQLLGDLETTKLCAERMVAAWKPGCGDIFRALAHQLSSLASLDEGEIATARREAEAGLALMAAAPEDLHSAQLGMEPSLLLYEVLAPVLWAQGFPDQALAAARESVARCRRLSHTQSLIFALGDTAAQICLLTGDLDGAAALLEEHRRLCEERGERGYSVRSRECMLAVLRIEQTGFADAAAAALVAPGSHSPVLAKAHFSSRIAEAVGRSQSPEEGLAALETATAYAGGARGLMGAELLRARASLLRMSGAPASEVEPLLRQALERASTAGLLSLELRIVTTLAEVLSGGGRTADAQAMLTDVIDRMPEGSWVADYKRATSLRERLSRQLPA